MAHSFSPGLQHEYWHRNLYKNVVSLGANRNLFRGLGSLCFGLGWFWRGFGLGAFGFASLWFGLAFGVAWIWLELGANLFWSALVRTCGVWTFELSFVVR